MSLMGSATECFNVTSDLETYTKESGYRAGLANDMDPEVDAGKRCSWREVDRNLREIAASQAALDAREAPWLRLAEDLEIWKPLGMVSALDYLERVMGTDRARRRSAFASRVPSASCRSSTRRSRAVR